MQINHDCAPDGLPWHISTLRNSQGMTATFLDWGATWLSARVPMRDGSIREALLGCPEPADYLKQSAWLGATVGRYANRIANARLHRDGNVIALVANQGKHQLHGGPEGFSHRRWRIASQQDNAVTYHLVSADGDQGFPGNLHVALCYELDDENTLSVSYRASVDRACPVNLTCHAYFNLDGVQGDIRQHYLQLNADRYLPVDSEGIPSGMLQNVASSGFDFRQSKRVAQDFLRDDDQKRVKGYDHAFLLNGANGPAAELRSSDEKLSLRVFTTAPTLQFYTGNYLHGVPSRAQGIYDDYQGIALESGFLPDSPNHPEWPQPDCWLSPGESYQSITRYQLLAV